MFGRRGKMRRQNSNESQNTTIRAIISLFKTSDEPIRVIVWENRHANIPFPETIFCGEFDQRFRYTGREIRRIY